jgi:hypothetical protein
VVKFEISLWHRIRQQAGERAADFAGPCRTATFGARVERSGTERTTAGRREVGFAAIPWASAGAAAACEAACPAGTEGSVPADMDQGYPLPLKEALNTRPALGGIRRIPIDLLLIGV